MRPQLGMTALLLLMIGSSLFLLRAHPGERELVQVTERGVPEGEIDNHNDGTGHASAPIATMVPNLAPESSAPKADTTGSAQLSTLLESARKAYAEERYDDAHDLAEQVILQGGSETGNAAMLSALALSKRSGCASALARFEALRIRYNKTTLGEEAAFHAAECHQETGQADRARSLYEQLRNSSTWGARARQRLTALPESTRAVTEKPDAAVDSTLP